MMQRKDGYAMIQVLVLIVLILLLLTSWFSASGFRHKTALLHIQKEEARCAAEAAMKLMEQEIQTGNTEWIETGLKKTETDLAFVSEDEGTKISVPIVIWANVEDGKLYLYAEAEVGSKKALADSILEFPRKEGEMTASNAIPATPSTAIQSVRKDSSDEK